MSVTIPEEQGGDPRGQTHDYEAVLAKINAEHEAGLAPDPAAAGGEPAPDETRAPAEPTTPDRPTQAAADAAPTDPPPPAEEVRISKREWEETHRRLNQYGQNLQQQRAEFDTRVQQALAGQGPDIERRLAETRREGKREAIRDLIADMADPDERRQQAATWQATWAEEDQRLAAERRVAEADQRIREADERERGAAQTQHLANSQFIATAMPAILEGFSPHLAAQVGQVLGGEVTPEDIKAYLLDPLIIRRAQGIVADGPAAMNQFQVDLVHSAAIHVRDQRAAKAEAAATKREARDNAGLGRGQAGGTGGATPPDLDQFKSSREKQGNYDAMLAAINDQHTRQFAGRR